MVSTENESKQKLEAELKKCGLEKYVDKCYELGMDALGVWELDDEDMELIGLNKFEIRKYNRAKGNFAGYIT